MNKENKEKRKKKMNKENKEKTTVSRWMYSIPFLCAIFGFILGWLFDVLWGI